MESFHLRLNFQNAIGNLSNLRFGVVVIESVSDRPPFDVAFLIPSVKSKISELGICDAVQTRHDGEVFAFWRIHGNKRDSARLEVIDGRTQLIRSCPITVP